MLKKLFILAALAAVVAAYFGLGLGQYLTFDGMKAAIAGWDAFYAENPALVLADEPTAALDKDSAGEVVDLLKRMGKARGTTTLLVTHDNRILDRADRIVTLEDGRIVTDEAPGG